MSVTLDSPKIGSGRRDVAEAGLRVARRYGRAFLESLPPVARRDCQLSDLGAVVQDWLGA